MPPFRTLTLFLVGVHLQHCRHIGNYLRVMSPGLTRQKLRTLPRKDEHAGAHRFARHSRPASRSRNDPKAYGHLFDLPRTDPYLVALVREISTLQIHSRYLCGHSKIAYPFDLLVSSREFEPPYAFRRMPGPAAQLPRGRPHSHHGRFRPRPAKPEARQHPSGIADRLENPPRRCAVQRLLRAWEKPMRHNRYRTEVCPNVSWAGGLPNSRTIYSPTGALEGRARRPKPSPGVRRARKYPCGTWR